MLMLLAGKDGKKEGKGLSRPSAENLAQPSPMPSVSSASVHLILRTALASRHYH